MTDAPYKEPQRYYPSQTVENISGYALRIKAVRYEDGEWIYTCVHERGQNEIEMREGQLWPRMPKRELKSVTA